jgi:hypothetical protein
MVEAKTDALPNRLRRCSSSTWPITARVGEVRFNDMDWDWGLKKPNGEYSFPGASFTNAADCLAGLKKFAAAEAARDRSSSSEAHPNGAPPSL